MTDLEAFEELVRAWESRAMKVEQGIGAANRCRMLSVAEDAHRVASTYRQCVRDMKALLRVMRARKKETTT